jgi:hypothetical protein
MSSIDQLSGSSRAVPPDSYLSSKPPQSISRHPILGAIGVVTDIQRQQQCRCNFQQWTRRKRGRSGLRECRKHDFFGIVTRAET